jgi:hypothetical protein
MKAAVSSQVLCCWSTPIFLPTPCCCDRNSKPPGPARYVLFLFADGSPRRRGSGNRRLVRGDIHGRVDHDILGKSLHQVGYCLSSLGKFAEAQPFYERAAAEAEKGDVHWT